MTSNINYQNIDSNFPKSGIDNPSQGFRDNFSVIKTSLNAAKTEIEDLQNSTAKVNASNNFAGNDIVDANLLSVTSAAFFGGSKLTSDYDVDFNNGHYQAYQIGKDLTLNLTSWPDDDRYAVLRVAVFGDATGDASDADTAARCQRDVGYILDGLVQDLVLGTNYNARFFAIAETNAIEAITYGGGGNDVAKYPPDSVVEKTILASQVQVNNLSEVYGLSEARVDAYYTELLKIIRNSRSAASELTFTNPSSNDTNLTSRIAAKDRLLANLTFIENEVNAWVAVNYPNTDHNVSKCTRDIKYAVHSLCYDILYGGNSATYDNAKFFFYAAADGTPGISPVHKEQTVQAYYRLRTIVDQIARGITVTKSAGNNSTQVVDGTDAATEEGDRLKELATIIADAVQSPSKTQLVLPSQKVYPTNTWAAAEYRTAKSAIETARTSIINAVAGVNICKVNFTVTGGIIRYDRAYPVSLEVSSAYRPRVIEFWSSEVDPALGRIVYARYMGEFDTTRYGLGGATGGAADSVDWANITNKPAFANVATSGNYTDLTNKPNIPSDLSDLTNDGPNPYLQDLSGFNTDDLPESDTNLYLNRENFGLFWNEYNSSSISNIVDDVVTDSLPYEPAGSVVTNPGSVGTNPSNSIRLSTPTLIDHYKKGMGVRIFGANVSVAGVADATLMLTSSPLINSILVSPTLITPAGQTGKTFSYKVAQFDFASGKISPASEATSTASIYLTNTVNNFNLENNITLSIKRASVNYGALIYRSVDNGPFNLIAVIGSKEFGNNTTGFYTDYYDFDLTTWSGKDLISNAFTIDSDLLHHFPLTPPTAAMRGWVNAIITNVDNSTATITLDKSCYFNNGEILEPLHISHDDTAIIQKTIDDRYAQNLKSIRLGDKQYIVSKLIIPTGFTMFGRSKRTTLRKLSWSSNTTNKLLAAANDNFLNLVSISDLKINGNMQNQWLVDDSTEPTALDNYIIDIRGGDHNFENLIVENVIGGGLYVEPPELVDNQVVPFNLVINLCQFENSGLTDRYAYPPLVASNGTQILVTNNVFKNYTDAVDVSATNVGVLNGNIVSNCGSGVLIFGSTKFISSPNMILGPAEEFLPGPDIFNSEYDSVNITLEQNTNFISGSHVYQENGEVVDLSANRATVSYRVDRLRKVDNVEELWPINNGTVDPVLIEGSATVVGTGGTANAAIEIGTVSGSGQNSQSVSGNGISIIVTGNINTGVYQGMKVSYSSDNGSTWSDQWKVPRKVPGSDPETVIPETVRRLYVIAVTTSTVTGNTTIVLSGGFNPFAASNQFKVKFEYNVDGSRAIKITNIAGLAATAKLANGTTTGIDTGTTVKGINGSYLYIDRDLSASLSDSSTIKIYTPPIYPITTTDFANGEFRFTITANVVNQLKSTYSYSALKGTGTGKDPDHIGLVYRAFLTEYAPSGTVFGAPKVLDTTTTVTYYEVTIANPTNIGIGSIVVFDNHGGTPDLNSITGEIIGYEDAGSGNARYVIKYDLDDITVPGTANQGTILVQNTYVLIKGRIL